jgi:hypothetical protein
MKNRDKQDVICTWRKFVQQYEINENRNSRIKRQESPIVTVSHPNYRGGFMKWILDFEDVFTEPILPDQNTWNDDERKKRSFVQNTQKLA